MYLFIPHSLLVLVVCYQKFIVRNRLRIEGTLGCNDYAYCFFFFFFILIILETK